MNIKNYKVIEVQDWDNLVVETYGRPYRFQQQYGCQDRGLFPITIPSEACDFKNHTIPEVVNGDEMGVSFKSWLERDPNQKLSTSCGMHWSDLSDLNFFWGRNFYPDIQTVANDLYEKGLIEAGEYSINIDW